MTTATASIDPEVVAAFVEAARTVAPDTPTACAGWSAHDVLAHVVAGGAEIARLVGERLAGGPDGPTEAFETREPPFRAVPYEQLVDLVAAGALAPLFESWAASDIGDVAFTGWHVDVATMARHVESELAIHAWDLSPDGAGTASLALPSLTAHAVRSLGAFAVINERAAGRTARMLARGYASVDARVRAPGVDDVRIRADATRTLVELVEPAGDAAIVLDAGARLLALWGRRASGVRSSDCDAALAAWLWP